MPLSRHQKWSLERQVVCWYHQGPGIFGWSLKVVVAYIFSTSLPGSHYLAFQRIELGCCESKYAAAAGFGEVKAGSSELRYVRVRAQSFREQLRA